MTRLQIPELGHGPITIFENEDGTKQLKDGLSRLWCACGEAAVHYYSGNPPQYQFQCVDCKQDLEELD
ncbi:hypothetical protein [Paenibacillus crassostreae]|uniref:Uncharacterized protein n=1 Tax=Paenibacillus crassostreae TaxID=1763538 RepID=A0A167C6L4_9BACL|nr:hypothetical protein [Paenibacillus crassostreae]AOZ91584.1 hypothetical protein LPB68_04715 [Paenibacillus crassostreae]OAB72842.1 hypothetical protein PNBC_15535 [Paenibacillus crassostreae]